jgi:hypothetical protein
LRVTLLNGGDDGFQQNVYGDLVTVERNISLRASSGAAYRILDEHGVCRSTSKKDLDSILDQLNIQVENPVTVLDQEEAKKFPTRKAQDKYQFFAKATELERMDRSYANVVDNVTELEENKKKGARFSSIQSGHGAQTQKGMGRISNSREIARQGFRLSCRLSMGLLSNGTRRNESRSGETTTV